MSRYSIPALNPDHILVVGWDDPFNTFFANVFDATVPENSDQEDTILMNGTLDNEIQTIEALQATIAEYGQIPADTIAKLRQDQANHVNWVESPLQTLLRGIRQQVEIS